MARRDADAGAVRAPADRGAVGHAAFREPGAADHDRDDERRGRQHVPGTCRTLREDPRQAGRDAQDSSVPGLARESQAPERSRLQGRRRVRAGWDRGPRRREQPHVARQRFLRAGPRVLQGAAADQAPLRLRRQAHRHRARRKRCARPRRGAPQGERHRGGRALEAARPRGQARGGRAAQRAGRCDLPDGRLGHARDDARADPHEQRAALRLRPGRRIRAALPLPDQARAAAGLARPRQEHAGTDDDDGRADGSCWRVQGCIPRSRTC